LMGHELAYSDWYKNRLKAFGKLVAEKEREQCALLCEKMKYTGFGYEPEAPRLAKKIRARSNQ